jgi:hypothetical protein
MRMPLYVCMCIVDKEGIDDGPYFFPEKVMIIASPSPLYCLGSVSRELGLIGIHKDLLIGLLT